MGAGISIESVDSAPDAHRNSQSAIVFRERSSGSGVRTGSPVDDELHAGPASPLDGVPVSACRDVPSERRRGNGGSGAKLTYGTSNVATAAQTWITRGVLRWQGKS